MKHLKLLAVLCTIVLFNFSALAQENFVEEMSRENQWNKLSREDQWNLVFSASDQLDDEKRADLLFKYSMIMAIDSASEVNEAVGLSSTNYEKISRRLIVTLPISVGGMFIIGNYHLQRELDIREGIIKDIKKSKSEKRLSKKILTNVKTVSPVIAFGVLTVLPIVVVFTATGESTVQFTFECSRDSDDDVGCPNVEKLRKKYQSDVLDATFSTIESHQK